MFPIDKSVPKIPRDKKRKMFRKSLKLFKEFMGKQNKLVTYDDLIFGLHYTHMTSWNRMDTTRCILRKGTNAGNPNDPFDAILNIEVEPFGEKATYVEIFLHKKGSRLSKNWVIEKNPMTIGDALMGLFQI